MVGPYKALKLITSNMIILLKQLGIKTLNISDSTSVNTLIKCIACLSFALFYVQLQSSDHGLSGWSFLLTADGQRAGRPFKPQPPLTPAFHWGRLRREENRKRQKRGNKCKKGERGAAENSRWMLSGLRGQHVLHWRGKERFQNWVEG